MCSASAFGVATLLAVALFGQEEKGNADTVGYRGVVVNEQGRPIIGATVRSAFVGGETEATTQTDQEGRFELSSLPDDKWRRLVFEHDDYGLGWLVPQIRSRLKFFNPLDLRVVLYSGHDFEVRVLDEQGTPVRDAKVLALMHHFHKQATEWEDYRSYLDYTEGWHSGIQRTTDVDGRCALPRFAAGTTLAFMIRHPKFATYRSYPGAWQPLETRTAAPVPVEQQRLVVRLTPGATVRGRLLVAGKPLEREGIHLSVTEGLTGRQFELIQTDAAGRYEITGLYEGMYVVHGARREPLGPELAIAPSRELPLVAGQIVAADLDCTPGTIVTGRVTDQDGQPISKQFVRAVLADLPKVDPFLAVTGPDGRYSMRLPEGAYRLTVPEWVNHQFVKAEKELEVSSDMAAPIVDFSIRSRPEFKFRLVDQEGRPVAGMVEIDRNRVQPLKDGEFSVPDPSGPLPEKYSEPVVCVSEDESLAAGLYWRVSDPLPAEIVMAPWAMVEGRLLGDGEVTSEMFDVELVASAKDGWGGNRLLDRQLWRATSTGEGRFQLWLPPGVRLAVFAQRGASRGQIIECEALQPGETRNIGDVRPTAKKKPASRRSRARRLRPATGIPTTNR